MEGTTDNYTDYEGITLPIGTYSYDEFTINPSNGTMSADQIPEEMLFGIPHIVSIVGYSSLFVISATGNLTVFITLFRNRNDKSRVNMFIMHLSIADLIVTFIMMPLEIGWNSTVKWMAGDAACRILMFLRTFGLYLSSFTLVVISLDRYFAILHPLSLNDADQRGKIMLAFAWLFSVFASFPQGVIFHVETHPNHTWYKQCVTFQFFPSYAHELVYNLYTMFAMYGLPLIVITLSYALILRKISMKTRQSKEEMQELNSSNTSGRLRRSAVGNIERARSRTLKMTIIIVGVFILCWTPYYVLAVWWWFDRETARNVDPIIQKGLFMFAVSNSCVNPIVYGLFTINFKREFLRCCCCLKSKWRNAKRSLHTAGGTQLLDGKSIYSRSTHSSLRASTTAVGNTAIKIKMERGPSGDPLLRFIARGDSQCQSNGAMKKSQSERGTQMRDTRHNSNNFLVIHMKEQDEFDF